MRELLMIDDIDTVHSTYKGRNDGIRSCLSGKLRMQELELALTKVGVVKAYFGLALPSGVCSSFASIPSSI